MHTYAELLKMAKDLKQAIADQPTETLEGQDCLESAHEWMTSVIEEIEQAFKYEKPYGAK